MTEKLVRQTKGSAGHVIFNNPNKHNALSLEMWEALVDTLAYYRDVEGVHVVVLEGAGGKAFVSGADISELNSTHYEEGLARYSRAAELAYDSVREFPKPTIANINGYCIGGGMALAACCDLRICTPRSQFGIPAAKLGVGYDLKNIQQLMNIVGASFTKEILFTARQFGSEEALLMRFANKVVSEVEIDDYVARCAESFARLSVADMVSIKNDASGSHAFSIRSPF